MLLSFAGESSVRDEDCPLVLALMATAHIQFILKVYQEGKDPGSPVEEKQKLSQSNSFFSAMKKKINKTKSKDKVGIIKNDILSGLFHHENNFLVFSSDGKLLITPSEKKSVL